MNEYGKLKTLSLLLVALFCIPLAASGQGTNIAYQDGQVRFTVVTDGTLRLEYAPDGQFVDDFSFVAVNRKYPAVDYKLKKDGRWVELSTSKFRMKYKKGSGRFTSGNLSIVSAKGVHPFRWTPGMKQKGNLKGTYRTLDGYDGDRHIHTNELMPLEDGLLATDGWTLIDDSDNFLFDDADWNWVKPREKKGSQDWYFMAYGHDYKLALRDYTMFAGKTPLPPRYAFGYWWSRYWSYSDNELRELLRKFRMYDIPLDVLVIDMDWHYTEPGKGGWSGWTWNKRLFPDPGRLLADLKKEGVKLTLNLHPADGFAFYEEPYRAIAADIGMNPEGKDTIPWVTSDKKLMKAVFKNALHPMEKEGVDFWWLDWQQFPYDKKVDSLNNVWWINYVFFTEMERNRTTRPMLYHRWGGLGNHRYQIGFSGDAVISWKSLDFQPYFNSTASNVLYGYWSHDLGGHFEADRIDPEMFTRWMQFGAVSPVMRTHSSKSGVLNKEPWAFSPVYFNTIRNTILQRYEMAPYVYTMARKTYDEGLSICRPLYYDYPESKEAYDYRNQYMFGDQMLIAPVTAPMKGDYSTLNVWLPAGTDWYEWHTGTMLKGGQTVTRAFAIDEYPIYIKAGSILPFCDRVKSLADDDLSYVVTVFPGGDGAFELYEDNGNDKEYDRKYARTSLQSKWVGNRLEVTIGSRKGEYPGVPAGRGFRVKAVSSAIPQSVTVNGKTADYIYDGNSLSLLVDIPVTNAKCGKQVVITYPEQTADLNGLAGKFRRLQKSIVALKYKDADIVLNEELGTMESTGRSIEYTPERMNRLVTDFIRNYGKLPEILKQHKLSEENVRWFLESVHWED